VEPSQKQNTWQLPAALNLTLGGMGAGFYLVTLLLTLPESSDWTQSLMQTAVFKLLGPVLVSVGLLSLTTEAGHPLHSIYLLTNLRRSWMSREALAGGIFIIAAGLDWLIPNPALRGVAVLAGLVFIVAQGMIVLRANSVITWNVPTVPLFFLTCGLATGSGLMLIVLSLFSAPSAMSLPLVGLVAAIANALVWAVYLHTPGEAFQRGIEPLRQLNSVALTIGVGHLLPIVLLIAALAMPQPLTVAAAGLALIFGGVRQKFGFAFKGRVMRSLVRV
jgi:DMSO reductase anchor subunit